MIVKVMQTNGRKKNMEGSIPSNLGFMLFDGIDRVVLTDNQREFDTIEEFTERARHRGAINLCSFDKHWDFSKASYKVTELTLWIKPDKQGRQDREAIVIFFDEEAFICNDNGKTIERRLFVHQHEVGLTFAVKGLYTK